MSTTPQPAANAAPPATIRVGLGPAAREPDRHWLLLIVAGALLLRLAMAVLMPTLSRDGVTFCWYARDLGQAGLAHLQAETTHQHPLFPAAVLAVQRVFVALGAADAPMVWQRSGQLVALAAGVAVILLTFGLTRTLCRRLDLPVDAQRVGLLAALLAAILPLNVALSADAMSDQMHLAWYLAGLWALVAASPDARGASVRAAPALLAGVCIGLAFLTRPEGAALLPAGLLMLAVLARRGRRWTALGAPAALVAGFVTIALPFWLATGTLSPKKNPVEWLERGEPTTAALRVPPADAPDTSARHCEDAVAAPVALGKLELLDLPGAALLPWVGYTTLRTGRVVVPLLAVLAVVALRRRLWRTVLLAPAGGFVLHAALATLLLARYHYLDTRHVLVLVMLLAPFAALALELLGRQLAQRGAAPVYARCGLAVLCLPLLVYALRVPNAGTEWLRMAGDWLAANEPRIASRVLLSGSSPKRVAFYAGCRWVPWYENPENPASVRDLLLSVRPDYFVVETGEDFERRGNAELLETLRADPTLPAEVLLEFHGHVGPRLVVLRFDWDAPATSPAE